MLASKANLDQVKHNKVAEAIDRFFTRVSGGYERRLRSLIRRPWLIVAAVGVLMVGGGLTFHFLPTEFAPMADVGRTVVFMEAPEGASFDYTTSNAAKLEAIVEAERRQFNDIDRVMLRLPGNFNGGGDVNSARIFLVLKDWHERKRSAQEIGQSIARKASVIPGVRINTFSPGGLGRGFGKPIQASLGGPDYAVRITSSSRSGRNS
jgi:multidrug efflux pump subunit AcrB